HGAPGGSGHRKGGDHPRPRPAAPVAVRLSRSRRGPRPLGRVRACRSARDAAREGVRSAHGIRLFPFLFGEHPRSSGHARDLGDLDRGGAVVPGAQRLRDDPPGGRRRAHARDVPVESSNGDMNAQGEMSMNWLSLGRSLIAAAAMAALAPYAVAQQASSAGLDARKMDPAELEDVHKPRPYSPYANRNFPTRPFFGDTHLHTE